MSSHEVSGSKHIVINRKKNSYLKYIWHFTKHEMRLHCKNGMYALYIVVNALYIVLLSYVPGPYKELATTLVLLTDPTFLGMIFVGGILLLEKNQGVPKGIGVTPLGSEGYIISKVASLLFISLILGTVIAIVTVGKQVNLLTLWVGLGLGASLFTLLGMIMGAYSKSSNQFLIFMSIACMAVAPPFFNYLGILDIQIFKFIPTYSVMCLISRGIKGEGVMWKDFIYLIVCLGIVFKLTQQVVINRIFRS
nr:hypothetical protein [uncultured Niameybacter sp.]